jgi:hypothetical protein
MAYRWCSLMLLLLVGFQGGTQSERPDNKYSVGATFAFGQSRPNWQEKAVGWGNKWYPAARLGIHFDCALNEQWIVTGGVGAMMFVLPVKTPVDVYFLDFLSPQLELGIARLYPLASKNNHLVAQFNLGLQQGFNQTLRDEFDAYQVTITGDAPYYYFIRPELGLRIRTKRKSYGSLFKMSYAVGVFYRYQFNELGRATFVRGNEEVVLVPPGSVLGIYGRWFLPVGKQRIQRKILEEPPPVIIYHPRMRD